MITVGRGRVVAPDPSSAEERPLNHHLPVHCTRLGHGHRLAPIAPIAPDAPVARRAHRPYADALPAEVLAVADDGTVTLRVGDAVVPLWNHEPRLVRTALARAGSVAVDVDAGLLLVTERPSRPPQRFSVVPAHEVDERIPCSPPDVDERRPGPVRGSPSRFRLPLGAAGGVPVIARALAPLLAEVDTRPDRYAVIVSIEFTNCFTQVLLDGGMGAWVEAVSDEYLEPDEYLGPDQVALLGAFGFDPPGPRYPNHHVILDPPTDFDHVAMLMVAPLSAVYGAADGDVLKVEVIQVARPERARP